MGVVDPFSVARAAGLELTGKPEGLTLTDGSMELRADFARHAATTQARPSAARVVGKGCARKRR